VPRRNVDTVRTSAGSSNG